MALAAETTAKDWTPEAAYRFCERLAKTHYENFTVGSWLLPKETRQHVYAIYAYCRTVDDLGDEATAGAMPGVDGLIGFPSPDNPDPSPFLREEILGGLGTAAAGGIAGLNGLEAAARAADGPPAGEQPATPHHHGNLLPS